jgi:hypothetical protein
MSVLAGPLLRALWTLTTYVRVFAHRAGTAPLWVLALAGAAVVFSRRARRRGARAVAAGTQPAGTGTRSREVVRPKGLAGVRRVTIGCHVWLGSHRSAGQFSEAPAAMVDPLFVSAPCTSGGSDGEELSGQGNRRENTLAVKKSAVPYLKRLAKMCDLYVITRVPNDETERAVTDALRDSGIFSAGLDERKALFCETEDGRISMVRQLEPHLHIDGDPEIVAALQRFIKFVALVLPSAAGLERPTGANVLKFDSLEAFWAQQ